VHVQSVLVQSYRYGIKFKPVPVGPLSLTGYVLLSLVVLVITTSLRVTKREP